MDIKQLRFFRKVYESQNMQHSADELFITRQGLRHVIKALECEIGEPLFEVRKNRLEPTEAAHKLYQLSDGAVAAFETVERAFAPAAPEEARTVRCATAYSSMESLGQAGQLFVIGNIPALDQPDVRYEFCYGTDEEIKEGIIGGSLGCGFFIGVGQRDPRLDYVEKRSGRLHLLVPANSSLAGRAEVGIDDLRGLPFSSQGAAFEVPTFLANACAQQGFALDVVSESLEIRPLWLAASTGYSCTYCFSDAPLELCEGMVAVPFDDAVPPWTEYFVTRKGELEDAALRPFAEAPRPE